MGHSERRSVPARRAESEQSRKPASSELEVARPPAVIERFVPGEIVQETAGLLRKKWSSIGSLDADDIELVAGLIHQSYPELGPAQVLNCFDWLGGRLYHNAQFYLDLAARHAQSAGAPAFVAIRPSSPEWSEWIGDQLWPATLENGTLAGDIAAAYLCEFRRKDREGVFVEVGVCRTTDTVLFVGGKPDRGLTKSWETDAKKTARTRAARRALRLAFSPSEARALYVSAKLELGLAQMREARLAEMKPYDAAHELFQELGERGLTAAAAHAEVARRYGADLAREVRRHALGPDVRPAAPEDPVRARR